MKTGFAVAVCGQGEKICLMSFVPSVCPSGIYHYSYDDSIGFRCCQERNEGAIGKNMSDMRWFLFGRISCQDGMIARQYRSILIAKTEIDFRFFFDRPCRLFYPYLVAN
jgi:hypothetical protein